MENQNKAKAYQRERQRLTLFHLVLTPALLCLALILPVSQAISQWARSITVQPELMAGLVFAGLSLYLLIFDLPFAVYSGYSLEKRYDLSNQTFGAWVVDFLKKALLSFAFSALLIVGLYALIRHFPERWWLLAWAAYAGISYVIGKIFPVLIVPLFYKYSRLENEGLKQKIVQLAGRYGLPLENVYSINLSKTTKKANAAFMGIGRTKRVVLSDTLLENFNDAEIEAVVAHELGHFKHADIWKQLILGLFVSFLAFWLMNAALDPAARALGFAGSADPGSMALLFLIFDIFSLVMTPLHCAFSRVLERAADRFALQATETPSSFISCMEKLAKVNLADPDPHPVYEWFFYDHPAISKRIKMAQAWNPKQ